MRRKNWELVFTAALALGFPATLLRAQETSHGQTGEVASLSTEGSAAWKGRSEIGKHFGSPYVELDSWIYPALERLAALGFIHSEFSDTRPWSRFECARMVQEAGRKLDISTDSTEAERLYATLQNEFQPELGALSSAEGERAIRLESLYSQVTGISGRPLNDSYHFGQTIVNNYGRPYQEGFNSHDGFSGYAVAGRLAIYSRGEFQHAPSAPAYPLAERQVIAAADGNPLQPATPFSEVDQFRLLDTYVAANVGGWDFTFGKQSLWWAPNRGGALLFSDNAEPIYMARVSRTAPFELPWIFRVLGPMKWDLFFGKLSGNQYPPRPLIHGEKVAFKPTKNLELSFSRTAEFGGVGRALTLGAIWHSYTSFQSSVGYPASQNPGERNGGFDFSYRVPGLRNWVTVYGDLASRDDPNPLDAPRRAAWNPGLYLAWIPYVPRLDFRVEAVNTNSPSSSRNGQFFYYESFYHDLYTNKSNLIGDWVGREGTGFQAWSTYWFSPRNTIQFGYRHAKAANDFIPSGETLNDGSVTLNWWLHDNLQFRAFVQYEKWLAPVLAPRPQINWTSSAEITLWPNWSKRAVTSARIDRSPEKSPRGVQTDDWTSPSEDETQGALRGVALGSAECGLSHVGQCLKDLARDQFGIWTSPLRLSTRDARWLLPFAGATGLALHYDAQAQRNLGIDKTRIDASNTISGFGSPYAAIAGGAGLYFIGLAAHSEHLTETGRLGAEAAADASLVAETLKLATDRQRPNEGDGRGDFWPHGVRSYEMDGSFPSAHAAASWALARVIASEYPSKRVKLAAYAFALAVSASRVTAREHFPSDVLVGGTFGYLTGGYVFHHHAAGQGASEYFIAPLLQNATGTYGLRLVFAPGEVTVGKARRFIGRLWGTS